MEQKRPALPFLDMSRKDVSRRKQNDDEERMRQAQRLRKRADPEVVPGASKRKQQESSGAVSTAFNPAALSSAIKPEPPSTSKDVNFGRAFAIRPLEEKGRDQRENTPVQRRNLDDILGTKESRTYENGPIIPKRRTINEILARPTLPNPKEAHVTKVKEVRAQIPEPVKREKELELRNARVGVQPRNQVKSVTDVVPPLLPPTLSADTMSADGWTATQGSVGTLYKMEGVNEKSNGHLDEFQDSKVRTEVIDNRTEVKVAQSMSMLSRKSYYNFERPFTARQAEGTRPRARDSLRWMRFEAVNDLPAELVGGDGDAAFSRSLQTLEFLPSATVTLMKIMAPGEEEAAENRARFSQTISTQTHMAELQIGESQTEQQFRDRKWTQMPPQVYLKSIDLGKPGSAGLINAQSKGVGPDPDDVDLRNLEHSASNSLVGLTNDAVTVENQKLLLDKFMEGAVKTMITALKGNQAVGLEMEAEEAQSSSIQGSSSFDKRMEKQDNFFTTKVICDGRYIASVRSEKPGKTASGYSTISVWEADFLDTVLYELRVWGNVDALDMSISVDLVVAGSDNGALSVFSMHDAKGLPMGPNGNPLRTASVYTGSLDEPHHFAGITAVQILQETDFSAQIISMDDSLIICWNCIHSIALDKSAQVGHHNAPWTSLRVRIIQQIDIKEQLLYSGFRCVSLKVWQEDETNFIIGGNYGFSVKGTICPPEVRSTYYVHYFHKHDVSFSVRVPNLDINCSREFYAVCAADNLHLIYLKRDKIICTLKCDQRPMKIRCSRMRACLFYVCLPNQISVYDLLKSDLLPITTFPFKDLVDFDVLTYGGKEYLAIVFKRGKRFHVESLKFSTLPLSSDEKSKFQNFISICS